MDLNLRRSRGKGGKIPALEDTGPPDRGLEDPSAEHREGQQLALGDAARQAAGAQPDWDDASGKGVQRATRDRSSGHGVLEEVEPTSESSDAWSNERRGTEVGKCPGAELQWASRLGFSG